MENKVLENIKTRRSVRKYLHKVVPIELMDKVLEAGTYAPSGMNHQSSTIVVINNKKTRDELSKLNASFLDTRVDPYYGAPQIIIVLANPKSSTYVEDGSVVLMNMMLAAHSLGLATVWVHREREMFASLKGKELLKSWGLDTSLVGVGSLAIGYPAEIPNPHPRKEHYIVKI